MIVLYSDVLNIHQVHVADELWKLTDGKFRFVELKYPEELKGGTEDYSSRPYLIKVWESDTSYSYAMELCENSRCCIFSGINSLPFEKRRLKLNKLSFDMGERWLKRGILSYLSPRLLKWLFTYHTYGWSHKKIYKLCCSAFCGGDHRKMLTFINKCYKWGYFTAACQKSNHSMSCEAEGYSCVDVAPKSEPAKLMWCSRFIGWKHPEIPIYVADKLRRNGRQFILNMYGAGPELDKIMTLAEDLNLDSYVTFKGNLPNNKIREAMSDSSIFLLTSDRNEGWGAVANECMEEGCALIASDEIGASPYLIRERLNGVFFKSPSVKSTISKPDMKSIDSLFSKIELLLDNPDLLTKIRRQAKKDLTNIWSPSNAVASLLRLISRLESNLDTDISIGPCSKD